jgi:hypothetical protein
MPFGSVSYEAEHTEKKVRCTSGRRNERWLDRLSAMHGKGESYSDPIIRLAAARVPSEQQFGA